MFVRIKHCISGIVISLVFQALEDILTNRIASAYSMKYAGLLRGLVFCCLHAGKKDLALKLQLVRCIIKRSNFVKFWNYSASTFWSVVHLLHWTGFSQQYKKKNKQLCWLLHDMICSYMLIWRKFSHYDKLCDFKKKITLCNLSMYQYHVSYVCYINKVIHSFYSCTHSFASSRKSEKHIVKCDQPH